MKDEKQSKIAFVKNFFSKKTMKPNFSCKFFFDEIVAKDPAQLLARTKVKFLLHPIICPEKPERTKFEVILCFKRSLLSSRTNYETMDCVFVLGLEI